MADDGENDDQWLYGDHTESNLPEGDVNNEPTEKQQEPENVAEPEQDQEEVAEPSKSVDDEGPPGVDVSEKESDEVNENEAEDGELRQNGDESDKEDLDDDSDDDVNVVIGDIKTTTSYTQLNIKRGGLTTTIGDKSKQIQQTGKFNVEEFEQIGTINGVPATDYNLDTLEDKPWRKPGADITDYFNYGFNEDTWKAYCERQKRLRINESGVGIVPLNAIGLPRGSVPVINDNSKYSGNYIAGVNQRQMVPQIKSNEPPKMNTIQVMTADRREYSRKPGFPDMSVPPPGAFEEFQPEYGFNPEPDPFYGGGYEPTQDSQWCDGPNPNWQPSEIKTLTGAPPPMGPPPIMGPPPGMVMPPMHSPGGRKDRESPSKDRDRDRERDSRSRSEKPRDYDRERERSRRRERSRSRSRRHKSRSRSPGHRSHKKKKSRRHEDSD